MRKFTLVNPTTIDEAVSALGENAYVLSGGTDLLDTMKDEVLPTYPQTVVNLQKIPGTAYIEESGGMLKIGAMTILEDIATSSLVLGSYTALAQAAGRTASPHIREMGTIGGNICQMNRCWFFRYPDNHFFCLRKGGGMCYATAGDNRYHAIFGGVAGCLAVNPSDTAPALVALNASIVTTKRTIAADDFWSWTAIQAGSTVLDSDEIVTEIQIPTPASGVKSAFLKFAIRKSIDFPLVNCAAMIGGGDARICFNAVFNRPHRAEGAETAIAGQTINEASAETAAAASVSGNMTLPASGHNPGNKWRVQIARTLAKRVILACAQ
jgi:xanthine dehydrogenase YagS FAD-binding subunit